MGSVREVMRVIPGSISTVIERSVHEPDDIREIRLRINQWVVVICGSREYVLSEQYNGRRVTGEEMQECFRSISEYSIYAYEENLRQGYITIRGGHRIGFAGKVYNEEGKIRNIKYITFINIRLAKEVKGCADDLMPYLYDNGCVMNTLIISPPGGGKTTLLRDIIRQMSDGWCSGTHRQRGVNVGVVDERSEICACYRGVPQNDTGLRTDVYDNCSKEEGIQRLVRTMAPDVIAIDELGNKGDAEAVRYAVVSGCAVVATSHGSSVDDLSNNRMLCGLINRLLFKRYVLLGNKHCSDFINLILDAERRSLEFGN